MSEQLSIRVKGMTCASCVNRVEGVLSSLPWVEMGTVNLAAETVTVVQNGQSLNMRELISAVDDAGFKAKTETQTIAVCAETVIT